VVEQDSLSNLDKSDAVLYKAPYFKPISWAEFMFSHVGRNDKTPKPRADNKFSPIHKTDGSILYDSSCAETVTARGDNEQNNGTPNFWAEIVAAHGDNEQNKGTPDFWAEIVTARGDNEQNNGTPDFWAGNVFVPMFDMGQTYEGRSLVVAVTDAPSGRTLS